MLEYPIYLESGETIRDNLGLQDFYHAHGFSSVDAQTMAEMFEIPKDYKEVVAYSDEVEDISHSVQEGCMHLLQELVEVVETMADRLSSGKKSRGYTKEDIALSLRIACDDYYYKNPYGLA